MRDVVLTLVLRKVAREVGWTLLVVAVMSAAFSAVLIVPSVGSSLGSGLSDYVNAVGTYIIVAPVSSPSMTLPSVAVRYISSIKGVEASYPFAANATVFVVPGGNVTSLQNREALSVVVGDGGFPSQLLSLAGGRLPSSPGEYVLNSEAPPAGALGGMQEAFLSCYSCGLEGVLGAPFNATEVGTVATDLYLSDIQVFWNATFAENLLGASTFQATFGNASVNYIVLKVDRLNEMVAVSQSVSQVLQAYPGFSVEYDQSLQTTLESFVTNASPAYSVLAAAAVGLVVLVSITLAQMISRRRRWELGLLVVQGWGRNEIMAIYFIYFLVLSFLSVAISSAISYVSISKMTATYSQYGGTFTIASHLDSTAVLLTFGLAFVVSLLSAYTMARGARGKALDRTFREL